MNIELRRERPADYEETENVTREAFWNFYAPGCSEHYLLRSMRDCPSFVPELDIVAVHEGKIVGNIAHTRSFIMGDNKKQYEVLTLGPISVLPEYQGKGIGTRLIEYTRRQAKEMGFRAILLRGDPDFYGRRGFVPAESFKIRTEDNMYIRALQVFELYEGALAEAKGRYYEDAIFNIDESLVAEYDRKFPQKEKISGTPSQQRFEEIVGMVKPAEE